MGNITEDPMKTILTAAMLAASALSGIDHQQAASPPNCAQRLLGKQLLGLGTVTVAAQDADGKYQVQIKGEQDKAVVMVLTEDQLCDFAQTVEPTAP
ncbi:MAG: hypothetical protein JWM80_1723 [Cyanobacteria bacterium RYN_339]|nr:hypothetical protein [Cyanobacteria bacterium RYN_339]